MRALVVWNPGAGSGRVAALLPAIRARLRAAGVDVDEHRSTSLDDARAAAAQAAGEADAVLAVGGDGTVGACAGGLAGADPAARAALGIVPAGTGNDLAVALGLPLGDPVATAGLVPGLPRRPLDVALANGRWFVNVAGAGLDSEVNRLANRVRLPGRARYVPALLAGLVVGKPARFSVELDGRTVHEDAWFVAVANGPSYGAGMRIAPGARLDDGLLDVVIVGAVPKPEFVRTLPKVFSGRHLEHPRVSLQRATRVAVDADRPVHVYADGEHLGTVPVAIEVRRAAIDVLAAPSAPGLGSPP
jgi:YegS/Rv2252/BmrU family lipid kinase